MKECDPRDVAAKSFFLGPRGENGPWFEALVGEILKRWLQWRQRLFPEDGSAISALDQREAAFQATQERFRELALELSRRFEGEIPKFSPRYLGHMFSEISLPALLGHWIATLHNPNTISSESAPVGVEIEREGIGELVRMIGFPADAVGHFTSCGTIANLEAVLRARDRAVPDGGSHPSSSQGPLLLVPENKHYSWVKAAHLTGLGQDGIRPVALDRHGTMKVADLEVRIEQARSERRRVALVASVLGTTELGNLDAVEEVQDLVDRYRARGGLEIWHHVDAAYGGFLLSLKEDTSGLFSKRAKDALRAVNRVTSITIDPHKLGYVPYACGAFICREERDYVTRVFDSPYIQYPGSREPGPFTIEGSRPASGAAATWLTLRAIGTGAEGYGRIVARTIQLRQRLETQLRATHPFLRVLQGQQSNVLCFTAGGRGESLAASNAWVDRFYSAHSGTRARFFVSKTSLSLDAYAELCDEFFRDWRPVTDSRSLSLIRLTLMNPFLRSREMATNVLEEFCREVGASLG